VTGVAPDILKTVIPSKNIPVPPRPPEISLPPWLDSVSSNGRGQPSTIIGSSDGLPPSVIVGQDQQPTDPRVASGNNLDTENDSSSSTSSSPSNQPEEEDDLILAAIALFFLVFFLVMGIFFGIYWLFKSEARRGRKYLRQVPFIHCLLGPDHLGNLDGVEKVSSVVHSSAYGSTTTGVIGTLGHHGFPIVATRVPTQIPQMEHSPTGSGNKFMSTGGGQTTTLNWYHNKNSYMTSNLRFTLREGQQQGQTVVSNANNNNLNSSTGSSDRKNEIRTGTTGPIVVNPVLDGDNSTSDNSMSHPLSGVGHSVDNLLEASNHSSSSNGSNSPATANNKMSQMITNSLYRTKAGGSGRGRQYLHGQLNHQDYIRRNLISNPWETNGQSGQNIFESINPRYASRPEILSYTSSTSRTINGQPLLSMGSHHLLLQDHPPFSQGQLNHHHHNQQQQFNNPEHVYECIDAESVNNFNLHHTGSQVNQSRTRSGSSFDPRILNV